MVAAVGFDIENADDIWIPDWGVEIELDLDVCQELGILWLPNLNAVGGGLLFDHKSASHGTLTNGPTWTKGFFGEPALSFDGTNDYVDIGVSFSTLVNITVAAWVYPTSLAAAVEIIAKDHSTAGQRCWSLQCDGALRPYVFKNDSSFTLLSGSGASLATNTWQHVAFTYSYVADGTSILTSFVNGTQREQSTSAVGPIQTGANSINIGRRQYTGAEAYWPGMIAGELICNRALTAVQIAELYRNPFLPYWQPSRTSIFDFRYDPTPYTRARDARTVANGTGNPWYLPGNVDEPGNIADTQTFISGAGTSEWLQVDDFGFIHAAGTTITGIKVEIDAASGGTGWSFSGYDVLKNGSPAATTATIDDATVVDTYDTFATRTVGGSSSLHGETWAVTDDIGFRMKLDSDGTNLFAYVNYLRATVYYSDGSGTTYTVTLSEGIKGGDTFAPTRRLSFTLTDGCVGSDTLTAALRRAGAISDGGKLGDTFVGLIRATKTITDGCVASDTFTGLLHTTKTLTDGCTLSDTSTAILRRTGTLSDGAILTDTLTGRLVTTPTITDGAKLSDTLTGGLRFSKSISDGAVGGDTYTSLTGSLLTLSDGAKVGDSLTTVLRASGVVSEGMKAGESLAVVGVFRVTIADAAVMGDTWTSPIDIGANLFRCGRAGVAVAYRGKAGTRITHPGCAGLRRKYLGKAGTNPC